MSTQVAVWHPVKILRSRVPLNHGCRWVTQNSQVGLIL